MAGLARELVRSMMAPAEQVKHSQRAAMADAIALMSRVPEASYRAALTAIAAFNRLNDLPRISVPTLCLAGEFDRTAAPQVMQRMAARIPTAHYQCLPGVGHLANMEDPQAFNAAVLNFLQNHYSNQEIPMNVTLHSRPSKKSCWRSRLIWAETNLPRAPSRSTVMPCSLSRTTPTCTPQVCSKFACLKRTVAGARTLPPM
jgi:hypothetical protein